MSRRDKILHYLRNSNFTAEEIGKRVGSTSGYVRFLAYSHGISMAGRMGKES